MTLSIQFMYQQSLGKTIPVLIIIAGYVLLSACDLSAQVQNPCSPQKIGVDIFKQRRQALLDSLGEGAAALFSQGSRTDAGYRADADFWYLTGIDEPGAILVLAPGEVDKEILLLATRNTEAERWTGRRSALTDSLHRTLKFDRIYRSPRLGGMFVAYMKHEPTLHLISGLVGPDSEVPKDLEFYHKISGRIPGVSIKNSSRFIETMRMIKSEEEIAAIEKAIAVTHQGLTDLIAAVKPGVTEYQLDGIMERSFKDQGAQFMAFEPIVGAGKETTILHYEKREHEVKAGQLLLLDVGAEWDRYAADISRTIPVDGKFTPEQAKIYDIVLKAQNAGIAAVKPGVTMREVHEIARDVIRKAGYVDDFIHGTSHHLGLDVHDVGDKAIPLAPGMIITVEPGIYLPDVDIGVRIEDDILVTKGGHRNLSKNIPRERAAVEAWIAEARGE